ncbi:MAG: PhoH family protein [Elusimicrobia bacterium]|nr:PhoH family protein [Elusimicrobiota bacterium]
MVTKRIRLESPEEALQLLGERDAALRQMERDFGVEIFLRQDAQTGELRLTIKGSAGRADKVMRRIREKLAVIRQGLGQGQAQASIPEPMDLDSPSVPEDGIYRTAYGKIVRARTPNQQKYIDTILSHELAFGIGPAGTGKTFIAVACALRALELRQVNRIILTRPVVEAGERLGFLPGDLLEKVNPYLKPLYDAFFALLGPERFRMWRDTEVIEIVPLAYMRGRTFEDSFILLDEAQNTTPEQMKMFLTRMGIGSRAVVTGDITQTDLTERTVSGLVRVTEILKGVEGVAFHRLTEEDVVRHPLVKRVIRAYDLWEQKQ